MAAQQVDPHGGGAASDWIVRWSHLVPADATVLDVACGSGRHLRWFAQRGCRVTGVDRDAAALGTLAGLGELVQADIEGGPWPFSGRRFDAVVVTNYLWRPLMPAIVDCVTDGGVLLYETFTTAHAAIGRPSNPAFLLEHGELLRHAQGLHVVAYEDGFLDGPPRQVQRLAAVRPRPGQVLMRHPL